MRIARRLSRPATGRWSFVQRVPVELRVVLDCRLIKRTLRTKDLAQATCVRSSVDRGVWGPLRFNEQWQIESLGAVESIPAQ